MANRVILKSPTQKLEELEKDKETNLLITINSNRIIQNNKEGKEYFEYFKACVDRYLMNIKFFLSTPPGVDVNNKNIVRDINIVRYFEFGKQGRLHCHASVEIDHRTYIIFEVAKSREYLKRSLEQSVHFDCKYYYRKGASKKVNSYILKDLKKLRGKK